jgi:tRNA threonylcarbamoyl adenosine modification protein YjeE
MKLAKKTLKFYITSEPQMRKLAASFGATLKRGDIVALNGNLGAGKTTFTKALLRAAGIKRKITSPTFVMFLPYTKGKTTYYHFDLYRAKSFKELKALGMVDILRDKNATVLIEWANRFTTRLPKKIITVTIEHGSTPTSRTVTIKRPGLKNGRMGKQ